MKNKYYVVVDEFGWKLHLVDRNGWEILTDRDGEGGWFTLFDTAEAAYTALEASVRYYADVPAIHTDLWTVKPVYMEVEDDK